ncbi:Dam family site-specific DNA-(adenine-N6)-methyltransferase [Klebsiella quasipneumoniae]|uniref:DNA adenine methylase n=1 Tax=Klebsiella quasipneumoniae TaxID=1463165 RepID=UPI001BD9E6E0|nr:Dam family site-specific DNA-(adenine-N6)-methyltransferase [Klebsiella quasipneumoniae]MBT0593752.1 Dam family site-specific DNA-(adenine-N6)-methyltransferase [Klebsiella quasipneumoniae]
MIKSPIKWAGGKTRVMPELLKHLPKADCLIEPFVGSGTVFMNTEYRRYVLCDSNFALINFFRQLKACTDDVIALSRELFEGGNDQERYYEHRSRFNEMNANNFGGLSSLQRYAALFLYLSRHCYNGVWRINLKGQHNVPFGQYESTYFPEAEMRLFAEKAKDTGAMFVCGDFRTTIPSSVEFDSEPDAVMYCDPPYIPSSKTANFTAYGKPFTLDDHRDLVSTLLDAHRQHGTRAVISNSDTPETREIYFPFRLHALSVRRSVSARSRDMAGEVIGVLRVCDGCGRSGGGYCPDCGPVMGASTYDAMAAAGAFDGAEGF